MPWGEAQSVCVCERIVRLLPFPFELISRFCCSCYSFCFRSSQCSKYRSKQCFQWNSGKCRRIIRHCENELIYTELFLQWFCNIMSSPRDRKLSLWYSRCFYMYIENEFSFFHSFLFFFLSFNSVRGNSPKTIKFSLHCLITRVQMVHSCGETAGHCNSDPVSKYSETQIFSCCTIESERNFEKIKYFL